MEEILSRIHTPTPSEMVGMEGSMHRPADKTMLDPIKLPQEFYDRELRGTLSSIHFLDNVMKEQADYSPSRVVASAILPSDEREGEDDPKSTEAHAS